jgi:hypothetical protein
MHYGQMHMATLLGARTKGNLVKHAAHATYRLINTSK